jgi:D-glycero-alpha-D-manno-heptose-7-phosphate kinase
MSQLELAAEAIQLERKVLAESGGWQDQLFASHGGLTLFEFTKQSYVNVKSVPESIASSSKLNEHILLVPLTGSRQSGSFSDKYLKGIREAGKASLITENAKLARETFETFMDARLSEDEKISRLGLAMRRAWDIKIETSPEAELQRAAQIIQLGISAGAIAGKLCGAGESGFILFIAAPSTKSKILSALSASASYSPRITFGGAQVTYSGTDEAKISKNTWNLVGNP